MSNLTTVGANKIQDYIYGGVSFTLPDNWYLAMSSTAPTAAGGNVTEPTDSAYERVAIPNSKSYFSDAISGSISNTQEHSFPESTENQGVYTHWALYDASVGGNVWFYGELSSSRTVESSTVLTLRAGSLVSTVS